MNKDQKTEHLMDMIAEILVKGQIFRPEDLVKMARNRMENSFRVSRKFVEACLDEFVEEQSIMRMIDGSYGAHERNTRGIRAALKRFIQINETCSRKEIWFNMRPPVSREVLDRMLRSMLKKGQIIKSGWGIYSLKTD